MYFRTGNLYKDFFIESKSDNISSRGRAKSQYSNPDMMSIKAVLAEANPTEKERWKQLQHPISHTIIQKGKPMANTEDKLILDERTFFVLGVDNIGGLELWSIYYVEERFDCNGN